jgi:hypothetical protein
MSAPKTKESQAVSAPVAAPASALPAPTPTPTISSIVNSSREERIKTFVPRSRERPIMQAPCMPGPEKVLNPDLHPEDVRLCVDIRLETRTEIIHERTAKNHSYKFTITKGQDRITALTSLSHQMGEIASAVRNDFEAYLKAKLPPPLIQKSLPAGNKQAADDPRIIDVPTSYDVS